MREICTSGLTRGRVPPSLLYRFKSSFRYSCNSPPSLHSCSRLSFSRASARPCNFLSFFALLASSRFKTGPRTWGPQMKRTKRSKSIFSRTTEPSTMLRTGLHGLMEWRSLLNASRANGTNASNEVIRHLSTLGEKPECENLLLVSGYFDNLSRLGLINIPRFFRYTSDKVYDKLLNSQVGKDCLAKIDAEPGQRPEIEKKYLKSLNWFASLLPLQ